MLLGLDDNDTVLGNALISQFHETLLDHGRKGGCHQIKPKVRSRGNLINILTARTLGTNGSDFDFIQWNGQMGAHEFRRRMIGQVTSDPLQNIVVSRELPCSP